MSNWQGLMADPAFLMGLGILSGNQQGNWAQGGLQGLANAAQMQQMLQRQAMQEQRQKAEQEQWDWKKKQQELEQEKLEKRNQYLTSQGIDPNAPDWMQKLRYKQMNPDMVDEAGVFGSVHFDPQGKSYILDKSGKMRPTDVPIQRPAQWQNFGGYQMPFNPITAQPAGPAYGYVPKVTETPDYQANVAGAKASAGEFAKHGAQKIINEPKQRRAAESQFHKTELLDKLIDRAKKDAGWMTTGVVGGSTSWIPGSPSHDMTKTLDTIRANIGFDRLQEMRDNSKTGGALGQVSEMENRLLQSVWGNLENSQSKEQFLENLEIVRAQVKRSWANVAKAYEQDYGVPLTMDSPAGGPATGKRRGVFNPQTGKVEWQ